MLHLSSTRTLCALWLAASLSLTACGASPPLPTASPSPASVPSVAPSTAPSASATPPAPASATAAPFRLRLIADATLERFGVQQADAPFALCLAQVAAVELNFHLPGMPSEALQAVLTHAGFTLQRDGERTHLQLQRAVTPQALLAGIDITVADWPAAGLPGQLRLLGAAQSPLATATWEQEAAARQVILTLTAQDPSDRAACPQLQLQATGATLQSVQGSVVAAPVASPAPSPSPSASPPVPASVSHLRVVETSAQSLTLQWDFGPAPSSHILYLNGQEVARNHTQPNYYRFDGLAPNSSYNLGVRAVNAAGEGPVATISASTTASGRSGSGGFSGGGSIPRPSPSAEPTPVPTPEPTPVPNVYDAERAIATTVTGGQQNPAMAMNASGQFVAVWESGADFTVTSTTPATGTQDGSGSGIFARVYNADGQPITPEFRVNTYTQDEQRNPTVGMDETGNFVIAWESVGESGTSGQSRIYAQRFDAQGQPQGLSFQVDSGSETHDRIKPTAAMLSDGRFVIFWEDFAANRDLVGQRFEADGTALGDPIVVGASNRRELHPQVVVHGERVMLNYNQMNPLNTTHRACYTLFPFDTPTATSTVSISSTNEVHPLAVPTSNDGFLYIYEQGTTSSQRLMMRPVSSSGNVSAAREVLPFINGLAHFSAAPVGSGEALLVWHQPNDADGSDIFARRMAFDGTTVTTSANTLLNSYTLNLQQRPVVGGDSSGRFVALWDGEGETDLSGIFGRGFAATDLSILPPPP